MTEPYFDFSVSEPIKAESSGIHLAYWKYRVNTKTTYEQFTRCEYSTYRRYNDFGWLRKKLIETHPGVLVPPLPEKDVKENFEKLFGGGSSHDETHIHKFRQRALRKFLVRVGAHPKLAASPCLREFIELEEDEFGKRKKDSSKTSENKILNSGNRMKQITTSFTEKISHDLEALKPHPKLDEMNPVKKKWMDTERYIVQLENGMNLMRERFEALAKKKRTMGDSLSDFGKALSCISEVERKHNFTDDGKRVGDQAVQLALLDHEHASCDTTQLVESLTYYAGMCRAAQGIIHYFKQLWTLQSVLSSELDSLKRKREKGGSKEVTDVLDASISEAMAKSDDAAKHLDEVSATFTEEIARFELEKQHDLKSLLLMNIELVREFEGKKANSWGVVAEAIYDGGPSPMVRLLADHLNDAPEQPDSASNTPRLKAAVATPSDEMHVNGAMSPAETPILPKEHSTTVSNQHVEQDEHITTVSNQQLEKDEVDDPRVSHESDTAVPKAVVSERPSGTASENCISGDSADSASFLSKTTEAVQGTSSAQEAPAAHSEDERSPVDEHPGLSEENDGPRPLPSQMSATATASDQPTLTQDNIVEMHI